MTAGGRDVPTGAGRDPSEGRQPAAGREPKSATPREPAARRDPGTRLPPGDAALDWRELFGGAGPVEIEIGSGKGRFLLAEAAKKKDVFFLGIEWKLSTLRLCAQRAARDGLDNVRLLRANAAEVLWSRVPAASVRAIHVYYPDPWWKARHRKRRLFSAEFVADAGRALAPAGELRVATDVGEYFVEILRVVAESGLFERAAVSESEFGTPDEPLTSYQAKYRRLGRAVHAARFVRTRAEAPRTPPPAQRQRLRREAHRAEHAREEEASA